MCFAFDASPPDLPADIAPIAGGAGAELLELESADGTRFSAALAESPEPRGHAVVILPDVRGLYPFYSELAERFSAAGHHAIAIDYFGRTAGLGPRGEDFEYMPHVSALRPHPELVQADAAAAVAALHERTGASDVAAVGFCFGGTQAFLAATNAELGLAGVIGFYGSLSPERWGENSPIRRAGDMHGPGAGAVRRRRRGHPARPGRGVRSQPRRGRRRARDRHLPGRPALLLRPPLRGARRGVRRRVAANPRFPLALLLGLAG